MNKLFGKPTEKSSVELENEKFSKAVTNFTDRQAIYRGLQVRFMLTTLDILIYMMLRLSDPDQSQPFIEKADNVKSAVNKFLAEEVNKG
jgi:hypothetical protein